MQKDAGTVEIQDDRLSDSDNHHRYRKHPLLSFLICSEEFKSIKMGHLNNHIELKRP